MLSVYKAAASPLLRKSSRSYGSLGEDVFDVIIVGGGLVGSALAAALSEASIQWPAIQRYCAL